MSFLEITTEVKPYSIFIDSSRGGKVSAEFRKAVVRLMRDPRLRKFAVVGTNRYTRVLGSFFIKAIKRDRDDVHFFDAKEEALAWLKAKS
jgi:hypothetical protein